MGAPEETTTVREWRLRNRVATLEAALRAVQDPHTRNELDGECDWCGHPWPCPTVTITGAALEGT